MATIAPYTPPTTLPTSTLQASKELQAIQEELSSGGNVNLAALTVRLGNVSINSMSEQVKGMMLNLTATAAKLDTANKLNAQIAAYTADRTTAGMADDKQFGQGSAELIANLKAVPGLLTDAEITKYTNLAVGNQQDLGNKMISGNGLTKVDIDAIQLKIKTYQDAASTQSQTFNMEINQKNNQLNQMTSLITTMAQVLNQANKTATGG